MKFHPIAILSLALTSALLAEGDMKIIFEDDFERTESQETKEEPGNGWTSNSAMRAKGNKQIDLKDGAMHIRKHKAADHSVSVFHDVDFRDGVVEMRFKLDGAKDSFGVSFGDRSLKDVHSGHIFKVMMKGNRLTIDDMKTGWMNLKYYEKKRSKTLTKADNKFLAGTKKDLPYKVKRGVWHSLRITIKGDTVDVDIDGKEEASFASEGFAHPDKKLLLLSVTQNAVVDDLKITGSK